jgi:prolyl oligopeptidase PreP (S9A serine peptidase family)
VQRVTSDTVARLRSIDALDTDLLELLEERDRRLYNIVSMATRYRTILSEQVQLLRAGEDPETVQAAVGRWQVILRDIKKLAADL